MYLEIIKKQMLDETHCVISVLHKFIQIFNKHYLMLISKVKQLCALYDQWSKVTNGELGLKDWITLKDIHHWMLKDELFGVLVDRWFKEITTVLSMIINSIPFYYSSMLTKNIYSLLKDDIKNFLTSEVIIGDTYCILFTFSRLKTINEEEKLLKCIKRASFSGKKLSHNGLTIIEDLYSQINPKFRSIHLETQEESTTENLNFGSNNICKVQKDLNGISESKTKEITLKYETGAEKMQTLNQCQTPIEKILMTKWVAESIKQDSELYSSRISKHPMWTETMISIFSYIIALSGNHLLFAHLYLANSFASQNIKHMWEEGYYLITLDAALSLLCEYQERIDELMTTIEKIEKDSYSNNKEAQFDSFYEIEPCYKDEPNPYQYNIVLPCEDSFEDKQYDYYIPKNFFNKL